MTATALILIDAVFEVRGVAAPRFSAQLSGTTCKLDLEVLQTTGKNVNFQVGAGRTLAFFVDYATWRRSRNAASSDLNSPALVQALNKAATTVRVQDRRIVGVNGKFEKSKNGTSVEIEGDLFWHDRARERKLRSRAGEVATAMTTGAWLARQFDELSAFRR